MPRRRDADVALRCVDLSVAHASTAPRTVDGVDLVLAHGACLVVMGPTGSGKSSLASVLAGADAGQHVVGGAAYVAGIPVRHAGRARRALRYVTGYLPQGGGARLSARLTVAEIVGEPITSRDRRVNRQALAVRVATLLDELLLPIGMASKYPYELSAGMRQRVAIARALMLQPRVLIADDLYANLDIDSRAAVTAAVLRRRDGYGMAALVVTNDTDAVRDLDADVLVLHGGHPVAYGHGTRDLLWTPSDGADHRLVTS